MGESLDIDPLLREFLELRRGLTSGEIDQLLIDWNRQGSLIDFLSSKALIDRTTAKMLITAQKGYLGSTEHELRTVLGIKLRARHESNSAASSTDRKSEDKTAKADAQIPAIPLAPAAVDRSPIVSPPQPIASKQSPLPEPTPPTQPMSPPRQSGDAHKAMDVAAAPKEEIKDPTPTPTPSPIGNKPRKSSAGRRGFLGASDEELRHILGSKTTGPGPAVKPAQGSTPPTGVAAIRPPEKEPAAAPNPPANTASQANVTAEVAPVAAKPSSPNGSTRSLPNTLELKPDVNKPEPKVGEYIDRYYLEESVGEGATATIFRSYHKLLRIPVAIKVYKRDAMASDPIGANRFLSEAQVLIRLEHPNIVRVLDISVHDGAPYIVFEYVGELSLQGMIGNIGHLPPLRVAQIGAQIAAALEVANSHGLLHRDVKPDNILIRKDGLAKLADFGIATTRASDGRTVDELARAGLISGTPQYISPEQITTPDQIDSKADMYSLGATLYHAASGHPPFERESLDELLHAQLEDTPVPLHRVDANIDPELSDIIDRMLSKEPGDRFRSLAEVRQRLDVVASRIQSEAMQRRRKSLSSSGISPVSESTQPESPPGRSQRSPRSNSQSDADSKPDKGKRRSSGNQKQFVESGSIELRSASKTPARVMILIALMVIATVIFVLSRFSH